MITRGGRLSSVGFTALTVGLTALFALPLYVLVSLALRPDRGNPATPLTVPMLHFDNFVEAWQAAQLGPAIGNSLIVTGTSLVLLVVLGSMAAYVLARRMERLSFGLYLLFLFGVIVPFQLGLIPLYELMRDLGLLGTRTSLILFHTAWSLPLSVFLYTGFLRAQPRDYEHAAMVDGATHWQVYRRIVLPLLRPVTGTVVIVNIVFIWNDFLTPLLYLSGTGRETIPIAIYSFTGQYVAQWNLLFAGMLIGIAPPVLAFFFMQKRVIRGFGTGLKG